MPKSRQRLIWSLKRGCVVAGRHSAFPGNETVAPQITDDPPPSGNVGSAISGADGGAAPPGCGTASLLSYQSARVPFISGPYERLNFCATTEVPNLKLPSVFLTCRLRYRPGRSRLRTIRMHWRRVISLCGYAPSTALNAATAHRSDRSRRDASRSVPLSTYTIMVKCLPGGTGGSKLAGLGRLILAVQPASYFREAAELGARWSRQDAVSARRRSALDMSGPKRSARPAIRYRLR